MPVMNQYQRQVAAWLDEWGLQWTEEYPLGQYSLDLYVPELRLAIEVDGPQHGLRRAQDAERDALLAGQGIRTIRLPLGAPKTAVHFAVFEEAVKL